MTDAFVVDYGADTGSRLKHFSVTADREYWTRRWADVRDVSYAREQVGHLPHQLRDTWRRSVAPGSRVLEAGCGLGHFSVAAHALGFRAEGIDWSEPTIDRLRRAFPSISWHVGDVRRLPFSDGSFDSVYSPGVCEHFEEGPVAILEETWRVLRKEGIAVVSTPCLNPWLRRRSPLLASREMPAGLAFFEYAFAPDGMASLLERLGFEVLQIRPYGALETLERYAGWRVPERVKKPLAFSLDYMPVVRSWGSTCIWLARKR